MDGIDHLGVLGHYRGVAVHDGWATYRKYRRPTHALCNVHHLRELQGAIERDPHTQTWAQQMDEPLRELKDTVERAKARGESALEAGTLEAYPRRYEQVIALGHRQNPPPTQRTGKRGPIGRSSGTICEYHRGGGERRARSRDRGSPVHGRHRRSGHGGAEGPGAADPRAARSNAAR